MVEASQAAAAASAAYQAQVEVATRDLERARAARAKAVSAARNEANAFYSKNPAAAAVVCLPDERVQVANAARASVHSSATSGGRDPM
jgi:hypothetical protein